MDEKKCSTSDADRSRRRFVMHMLSSEDDEEVDDDDDDEPRLQIDLGSAEEESTHCSGNNRINNVPLKKRAPESPNVEFSQASPLKSLQKLVHSPFLSTQISSAETGGSQGCDSTSIVSGSSKSTNANASSRPPSRPTSRSSSAINHESQSSSRSHVFNALPHLTPRPGAQNRQQGDTPYPETLTRMQKVVNRLQVAAKDERNLRKLRELPSEEAKNFAKFRQMLGAGITPPFPKNLDSLPILTPQHTNFGKDAANKYCVSQELSNPLRLPPTLQVISLLDNGSGTPRKPNCRRSPPPMVPIDSISTFRKPLNEDNVVHRLKKLGTVIELEKKTPTIIEDDCDYEYDYDDFDEPFPISVDCVLSTEPPVVTKVENKANLPLLKPLSKTITVDQSSGMVVTRVQPPPPSLIPINRNVAKQPSNANSAQQTSSSQLRFVPILPRVDSQQPKAWSHQPKKTAAFKKKRQKTSNKSDYAKLAHALVVQPAGSARSDEDGETELIKVINNFRKANAAEAKRRAEREVEITKVEQKSKATNETVVEEKSKITAPATKEVQVEQKAKLIRLEGELKSTAAAANETLVRAIKTEKSTPAQPAPLQDQKFEFSSKQAVNHSVMPNGRKLYACSICSAVYHKMYSVKKHYFRSHVNPRYVSEHDALKFSVATASINEADNHKRGMFRCSTCRDIFDDKEELKSHLLEHRPTSTDASSRPHKTDSYRCQGCGLIFRKKRVFTRHLLECASGFGKSQTKADKKSATQVDNLPASEKKTANEKKVDEDLCVSLSCLFCEVTFKDTNERQKHVLQHHHPKRKQQVCSYCTVKKRVFSDLGDLLKHICETHKKKYFGCANCKIRFKTKEELMAHDMESHLAEKATNVKVAPASEKPKTSVATKNGKTFKCSTCFSLFNSAIELSRHRKKGHRNVKPNVSDNQESKYRTTIVTSTDYETEFYLTVAQNVRLNVEVHMEGKLETKKPAETKSVTRSSLALLNEGKERESELSFQDMYGVDNISGRFIRNVSRLHLDTQLTMLKKANLLDKDLNNENGQQNAQNPSIAMELSLTPQKTDSASSAADSPSPSTEKTKDVSFTGEWIKGRKYICGACFARFGGFWELDDHRWTKHPNVWNSHYEFPIEQAPGSDWAMKRLLQSVGVLGKAPEFKTANNVLMSTCTKCEKVFTPVAEFHKHILECGGDIDWMSTMYTPTKKQKKWRPYCGHRRKKTVPKSRMFLRNIPETPIKLPSLHRGKQRAGDTETIQKMIANLPPKRITRRVFTFEDLDLRSRSRYNTQVNALRRKRKDRLDPKTSAQIAKTFAIDSFDVINSITKKKKSSNFSKSPSPSSDVSASSSTKCKTAESATTIVEIKSEREVDANVVEVVGNLEVVDNSSISTSDTEMSVKDADVKESPPETPPESPEVPPESPQVSQESLETPPPSPKPTIVQKPTEEEDEETVFDLEQIEPADEDSPLLPDSSVIIAAMRETMLQTDPVIHKQTFNLKKRKREEAKCKKCGLKLESATHPCLACAEFTDAKPEPTFITCKECGFQTSSSSTCEKCGASLVRLGITEKVKPCGRCDRTVIIDEDNAEFCDICTRLQKITCAKCKSDFVRVSTELVCSKCSDVQLGTSQITTETVTSASSDPVMSSCNVCDKQYPKSESQFCSDCLPLVPKTVESLAESKNAQMQITEVDAAKAAIKQDNSVDIEQGSVDIKQDDVCVKQDSVDCVNCSNRCEDANPEKGMCRECYSVSITFNTKDMIMEEKPEEPADVDCRVTDTNEVNGSEMPKQTEKSIERRHSSENGVQAGGVRTKETTIKQTSKSLVTLKPSPSKSPIMPNLSPNKSSIVSIPSSSKSLVIPPPQLSPSKPPTDTSEGKSNRATNTNNVLLICKGCYGLFNTVSAYMEHCEGCAFRSSHQEATEKKPLLGFAKRSSKGCVEVIQTDAEMLENIKKTEGDEMVAQINAAASKKPRMKRASDKSICEAIDSVVKKCQSMSPPAPPDTELPAADSSEEPPLPVTEAFSHDAVPDDENAKKRKSKIRRKPVDSPTRERNMKTVETELERQLESQKVKKAATRKQILFPGANADQTVVSPAAKQNSRKTSDTTNVSASIGEEVLEEVTKSQKSKKLSKKSAGRSECLPNLPGKTGKAIKKTIAERSSSTPLELQQMPINNETDSQFVPSAEKLVEEQSKVNVKTESVDKYDLHVNESTPPPLIKKQPVENENDVKTEDSTPPRLTKKLPRKKQTISNNDAGESLPPPLIKKPSTVLKGRKSLNSSLPSTIVKGRKLVNSPPSTIIKGRKSEPTLPPGLKSILPTRAPRGNQKTGKPVKPIKRAPKKRRAVDDIIDQGPGEILSSRLRRKSTGAEPPTRLFRRSKTKTEKFEEKKSEAETLEETSAETQEVVPSSSIEPVANESTGKRKSMEKKSNNTKISDSVTDETPSEIKPKSKAAKRKSGQEATSKKGKSPNNDLGFSITKTGKTVCKNTKNRNSVDVAEATRSETEEDILLQPLPPKLRRYSASESDFNFSHSSSFQPSTSEATMIPNIATVSERNSCDDVVKVVPNAHGDFLDLVPSVPPNLQEQRFVSLPEYGNAMLYYNQGEPMENGSHYEQNDVKFLSNGVNGQTDILQPEVWYSDAIEFLEERTFRSLGSIINHVNELLLSPDMESCPTGQLDQNHFEEFKQNMIMLQQYETDKKLEDLEMDDDDSPVIMDLDEQSKFNVKTKIKTEPNKDTTISTPKNGKEICGVCDQKFASTKSLQAHIVKDHPGVATDDMKNSKNGRVRSSNKNQQNGIRSKLRCNHCQKVMQTKSEMAAHLKEHLRTFAMSKKDNAVLLKKCIAEKFEELLMDKALNNYLRSPEQIVNRTGLPLKILAQMSQAKKNHVSGVKATLAQMLELESLSSATTSNADKSSTKEKTTSTEKSKNNSIIEIENPEGYPCPMCPQTFALTNQRNRHLIMVHAPRTSTHKHLRETDSAESKKVTETKSSTKDNGSSCNTKATIVKTSDSPLLNNNVAGTKKSSDDGFNGYDSISKPDIVKKENQPEDYCGPETIDKPDVIPSNKMETIAPLHCTSVLIDSTRLKKNGKPCRKKMSKKEMNLPPDLVKRKAEQALRELTISRFQRIN